MPNENKNEYLGDFGGVPKEGAGHGQAAEDARSKPFDGKKGLNGAPEDKAVKTPPKTKALQAAPENK